jgi:hypothetical protein
MGVADPGRFEPLLGIRKVAQHAEIGRVAEAAALSNRRDREAAQAALVEEEARLRLDAAVAAQVHLVASGTTAGKLCLAYAYRARCQAALLRAQRELASALGARGDSDEALQQAGARLAQARGGRQVVERAIERARLERRQLDERRRD